MKEKIKEKSLLNVQIMATEVPLIDKVGNDIHPSSDENMPVLRDDEQSN